MTLRGFWESVREKLRSMKILHLKANPLTLFHKRQKHNNFVCLVVRNIKGSLDHDPGFTRFGQTP
jgi:hypothetical protein